MGFSSVQASALLMIINSGRCGGGSFEPGAYPKWGFGPSCNLLAGESACPTMQDQHLAGTVGQALPPSSRFAPLRAARGFFLGTCRRFVDSAGDKAEPSSARSVLAPPLLACL